MSTTVKIGNFLKALTEAIPIEREGAHHNIIFNGEHLVVNILLNTKDQMESGMKFDPVWHQVGFDIDDFERPVAELIQEVIGICNE